MKLYQVFVGQSEPRSKGNERVLDTLQSSRTGTSPSDVVLEGVLHTVSVF